MVLEVHNPQPGGRVGLMSEEGCGWWNMCRIRITQQQRNPEDHETERAGSTPMSNSLARTKVPMA